MRTKRLSLVICFALALFSDARAGLIIDVVFVFNVQASAQVPNKQFWVNQQIGDVNAFLALSGRPNLRFNAWVDPQVFSYSTSNKHTSTVINWMQLSSTLAARRGSADLLVLVGTNLANACGAASPIRTTISHLNADLAQYAVIDVLGDCTNPSGLLLGHELGHLLYLEHQVALNSNGSVNLNGDDPAQPNNNRSVNIPAKKNHGYVENYNDPNSLRSLMANPISTVNIIPEFTDGSGVFDPVYENQVDVLGYGITGAGGSWDAVSRYRNPPSIKAYFQTYCWGSFVYVLDVQSLIPGVHISYQLPESVICYAVAQYGGGTSVPPN